MNSNAPLDLEFVEPFENELELRLRNMLCNIQASPLCSATPLSNDATAIRLPVNVDSITNWKRVYRGSDLIK
jgi:hypothetical protein